MNYKLSILAILLLSSGISQPAHAGFWDYIRNSRIATAVWGKPTQPNYTEQTRLPIVEVQPSIWARMFNFFSWMNFTKPAQPSPTPQATPQPVLSPQAAQNLVHRLNSLRQNHFAEQPDLSSEARDNLFNHFNTLHENYEAKKRAELDQKEKDDKLFNKLIDQKIELRQNLEKAQQEAQRNKNGWNSLAAYTIEKEKELANAEKEKEILLSVVELAQKESDKHIYEKNNAVEELRKFKLTVEKGDKLTREEFEKAEQQILQLKRERELARSAAQKEAREQIESLTKTISTLTQEISNLNTKSSSTLGELRAKEELLERKSKELLEALNEKIQLIKQMQQSHADALDEAKRDNTKLIQELESSKQQASSARSSSLELNRQLIQKNEEIQNVEQVYKLEISEIQQLLTQKRSEIDRLQTQLEQDEKQKKETRKIVTNFEHQMSAVLDRFNTGVNTRLHVLNGKLDRHQKCVKELRQHLPNQAQLAERLNLLDNRFKALENQQKESDSKSARKELPVIVGPSQEEVNQRMSQFNQKLTEFENQQRSSVATNGELPIDLLQSKTHAQALNRSVTGEIAESFSPLTVSSSPELPITGKSNSSESILDHVQIDPVYYITKAKMGREYLQQINQGNILGALKQKSPDEHIDIIEAILYRLHQSSNYKGQGLLEGTYVIRDTENFDLYNTYLEYVKKVNPEVKGTLEDPLAHVSFNAYGYARDASHYTYNKDKYRYYGIDLRRSDKTTFSLPGNHSHILFGIVDKDKRLIFIKPEHKGIYILDGWLGHCGEFITAQCRKNSWFGKTVRAMAGFFGYEIWTDDNNLYHKERIPADFLKQFGLLLAQEEALNAEQKAQLNNDAKKLGIQTLANAQIVQSVAFQQMKAAYLQKYDHLEDRSGREVQFNLQELITLEQ